MADVKEYGIKIGDKNLIVIGNPEGLNIRDIINKLNTNTTINGKEQDILVLGNIIGSTFSKNPDISKFDGEGEGDKLHEYYKNIIINKSFNDENINFCNKDNVTFIMGNRELDLIKIKKLVKLNDQKSYKKDIKKYLEVREEFKFEIESISSFYPFWVKYYFKDNNKIPPYLKFLDRFKKIFKSIDAEMLLFTIYYEFNKKNTTLLEELSNLAILYFYNMKQSTTTDYETSEDLEFNSLLPLEKLDFLAYYLFAYFSDNTKLDELLNKAEFILPLKTDNNYYLFSHGGIPRNLDLTGLKGFISNNEASLTSSRDIVKKDNTYILDTHNNAKLEQAKYYEKLIDEKCLTEEIKID